MTSTAATEPAPDYAPRDPPVSRQLLMEVLLDAALDAQRGGKLAEVWLPAAKLGGFALLMFIIAALLFRRREV